MFKYTCNILTLSCLSLFIIIGCTHKEYNPYIIEIEPIHPKIINLDLIVGKTTKEYIISVLGEPTNISFGEDHSLISYSYRNSQQENSIIEISLTNKDSYKHISKIDLRDKSRYRKYLMFTFEKNILTNCKI